MIRRIAKFAAEVLGAVAAGAAIVAAVAVWRLSSGPISLDFLTPYIETALTPPDGSLHVRLDRTVLAWQREARTVDIEAVHVRAYDATGQLVASVPRIEVSLSVRAMLHGLVAPTSLTVAGARVHLKRTADGHITFELAQEPAGGANPAAPAPAGAPPAQAAAAGPPRPVDILPIIIHELLERPDPTKPTGYLRRVTIRDADLDVDDSHWDASWKARLGALVLERDSAGIRGTASIDVVVNATTSQVRIAGTYRADDKSVALEAVFSNVRPTVFAHATPMLARLSGFDVPLNGTMLARIGGSGTLDDLHFQVTGAAGSVSLPDLYPAPVAIKDLAVSGALIGGGAALALDQFRIDLGGPVITVSGTATGLGGDTHVGLNLSVKGVEVDDLDKRWPPSVAPSARQWIITNLSGGQVDELRLTAAMHGHGLDPATLALDNLKGTMKVAGVNVHYLGKMPKVRKVGGDISFDDKTFTIRLDRGTVTGLTLLGASIVITGLDATDQAITIDLTLQGPLRNALEVVDSDPLRYASSLGVHPTAVSGQTTVHALFRFPLTKDLRVAQVQVATSAELTDVTLQKAFGSHDLRQGALHMRIDKTGMDLAGQADIGPIPVSLDWQETFGKKPERRIILKATLDQAARHAFGIDTAPVLTGPVPAVVDLRSTGPTSARADITLDLARATLTLPEIGWNKPPGVAGTGRIELQLQNDEPTAITSFELAAKDLHARGSVAFAPQGNGTALKQVVFKQFDFGLNRLSGDVFRRGADAFDVRVTGDSLDAAPFLETKPADNRPAPPRPAPVRPPEKGPKLDVAFDVKKLWLTSSHKLPFLAAKGTLSYDGLHVTKAAVTGNTGDGQPIVIEMTPVLGGRTVKISSNDAGSVLKTLGILDNVVGGKLLITATLDDADPLAPVAGVFSIENYQLKRAPALAKVLTLASLTGIRDRLTGQGISMTLMRAPFAKYGDKIDITDGRAVGSDLGITFDGAIDVATNNIDIGGTIVPIYTLNSLLGHLPVIGNLLVGRPGSGVFAATYRARGNFDNPNVTVNPLSALAPGILRGFLNIFGGPPPAKTGGTMPATPPPGTDDSASIRSR